MEIKKLISVLGFTPKDNTQNIFIKEYADNYAIEVDFTKEQIDYGDKIIVANKSTSNFAKAENFIVLECVNRLLETGYNPEYIVLEPTWKLGHSDKGRLDILVKRPNDTAYLMIECKTFGKAFDNELKNIYKDGGQLFSYFQQDKNTELLMLYTSKLNKNKIEFLNEIIKIEPEYRTAGSVIETFEKWNKISKNNGVWENSPYNFKPKTLTICMLDEINDSTSSKIFNRFLEILRHNVVSDKPNAFNKIFTLFLCKIYDEKDKEGTNNELEFQWKEGIDDHISFQIRLTDLYQKGMKEFLEKEVTDLSDEKFNQKYKDVKDEFRKQILDDIKKIRLEKNNEFAIKDVYDEESFKQNAVVVKEIVELLQGYKLRYTKKQQYLSDFFELLLTTGLKQEAGQFFTPVPIAQFILKSLPLDKTIVKKIKQQEYNNYLPFIIDYAAGSGHFLTEAMHEIQKIINTIDPKSFDINSDTQRFIKRAQEDHFDWALKYVYGIEKDYRLVKVGKVGCYLHGDGLANVIHSDGLAHFGHKSYKDKLMNISDNIEFSR